MTNTCFDKIHLLGHEDIIEFIATKTNASVGAFSETAFTHDTMTKCLVHRTMTVSANDTTDHDDFSIDLFYPS
jgi:hypothetical protein